MYNQQAENRHNRQNSSCIYIFNFSYYFLQQMFYQNDGCDTLLEWKVPFKFINATIP